MLSMDRFSAPDMNPSNSAPPGDSPLPTPFRHRDRGWVWRIALVGLLASAGILLLVWPYQHWQFDERSSVLGGWLRAVIGNSEWQFCLVVPILVGYLIYRDRKRLRGLPLNGSWWGLGLFICGLVFYWMGYKVDTGYLGFLAAHIILAGLILFLGGPSWARALFFPWLFLAFMWPMFPLEERLAFPLRMFTANASAIFLNWIGIDVVREGTALHSAGAPDLGIAQGDLFRLDVEEPCSGIRSLFSLLMVSALYGYLSLKSPVRRLLLFLSAIPLAIVGNFVRMILLAAGSQWFGSEFAVGRNIDGHQEMSFFHSFAGYMVFAVALAGMFGVCSLLERRHWRRKKSEAHAAAVLASVSGTQGAKLTIVQTAIAVALSLAAIVVCQLTDVNPGTAEPGIQLSLPLRFQGYEGQAFDMTANERSVLDEGVELSRIFYASPDARRVLATVIVGGPGKRTLHRPEVCLPGQGWIISSSSNVPIVLAGGQTVTVTLLRLFRDATKDQGRRIRVRALNFYWYIGSDGSTRPDYYGHIAKGYQDAILRNLNHRWSMVSFFVPVSERPIGSEDPFGELKALEDAKEFASQLVPTLLRHPSP